MGNRNSILKIYKEINDFEIQTILVVGLITTNTTKTANHPNLN